MQVPLRAGRGHHGDGADGGAQAGLLLPPAAVVSIPNPTLHRRINLRAQAGLFLPPAAGVGTKPNPAHTRGTF